MRWVQMLLAIFGFVVLFRYGVVRVPGFGDATSMEPPHWLWHTGPAALGIVCIVAALALVTVRNE